MLDEWQRLGSGVVILHPSSVKHKGLWTKLQKSGVLWADSRGQTLDSWPPCIHTRQPLSFKSASEADCGQWTWDSISQKVHQLQKVLVAGGEGVRVRNSRCWTAECWMLVSGSHPHMKVSQLQKCFGGRLYCAQHCSQANFGQQLKKTFRGLMKGGR